MKDDEPSYLSHPAPLKENPHDLERLILTMISPFPLLPHTIFEQVQQVQPRTCTTPPKSTLHRTATTYFTTTCRSTRAHQYAPKVCQVLCGSALDQQAPLVK